jgi:hypothetical protein
METARKQQRICHAVEAVLLRRCNKIPRTISHLSSTGFSEKSDQLPSDSFSTIPATIAHNNDLGWKEKSDQLPSDPSFFSYRTSCAGTVWQSTSPIVFCNLDAERQEMVHSFRVASGIQDFDVAFAILLEMDWQLEQSLIAWQATAELLFNSKPTILSLVKRDLMAFLPWIRDGYVDFVDTFAPVRCIIMCGTFFAMVHNTVLSILHLLWRKEKNWVEFSVIQLSNALCIFVLWNLWNWAILPQKLKSYLGLFSSTGYMVANIMNLTINASVGRTSTMALMDSVFFCLGSILTLRTRKMWYGGIANLSPCFSWHFCKRAIPPLAHERGLNISHLLCSILIFTLALYAGIYLQPHIVLAVEQQKVGKSLEGLKRARRMRQSCKSDDRRQPKTPEPKPAQSPIRQQD